MHYSALFRHPLSEKHQLALTVTTTSFAALTMKANWYLSGGVGSRTAHYWFLINLLLIYSDKKYMAIILVPNCTCVPSFNFRCFTVSEQLRGEQQRCQSSTQLVHLIHGERQLPLRKKKIQNWFTIQCASHKIRLSCGLLAIGVQQAGKFENLLGLQLVHWSLHYQCEDTYRLNHRVDQYIKWQ